jgi:hypothetical protein
MRTSICMECNSRVDRCADEKHTVVDCLNTLKGDNRLLKSDVKALNEVIETYKLVKNKEIKKLKELLEEANDWICSHVEAKEQFLKTPDSRSWCCDCSNYIRTTDDATLKERINEVLGGKP